MSQENNKNKYMLDDDDERFHMVSFCVARNLSGNQLKTYLAIRELCSFKQDASSIAISTSRIAEVSGLGKTTIFSCLNALEHQHFMIKRVHSGDRLGMSNLYLVSKKYHKYAKIKPTPSENERVTHSECERVTAKPIRNANTLFIVKNHSKDKTLASLSTSSASSHAVGDSKPRLKKKQVYEGFRDLWNKYMVEEVEKDLRLHRIKIISTIHEKKIDKWIEGFKSLGDPRFKDVLECFEYYLRKTISKRTPWIFGSWETASGNNRRNDFLSACNWHQLAKLENGEY